MPSSNDGARPDGNPVPPPPFGGAELEFPVSFDLRIIYVLASGATLEEDVLRILGAAHANPSRPTALPAPGSTYGRLSVPVTFADRDGMYRAYAALGELACVKAVM